ncbi:hypothetical protein [Actinomyces sp.]
MRIKLTRAAIALLFVAATPILAQQSTQATKIAGPATPNSTEPMIHLPKRSELAKTGFGSEVLIAATLVATAGAATFTARKHRA